MSLFRGDTGAIPCLKKAFTLVLQNVVWGYLNGRLLVYVTTSPLKRYRGNLSCVGFPRSWFQGKGAYLAVLGIVYTILGLFLK